MIQGLGLHNLLFATYTSYTICFTASGTQQGRKHVLQLELVAKLLPTLFSLKITIHTGFLVKGLEHRNQGRYVVLDSFCQLKTT